MSATNVRQKSVAAWGRVWEVLCPDCGEIRSLKGRPRGLVVGRCHPCGVAAHQQLPWHWALGYGGAVTKSGKRQPHGAPCMIVRCGLCNEPRLVITSVAMRGVTTHCRRCYARCSTRWDHKPETGDKRRRAEPAEKALAYA